LLTASRASELQDALSSVQIAARGTIWALQCLLYTFIYGQVLRTLYDVMLEYTARNFHMNGISKFVYGSIQSTEYIELPW